MIWMDPHLYEKGSFYAHTLPATEGGIQWRGGGGVLFLVRISSALVVMDGTLGQFFLSLKRT